MPKLTIVDRKLSAKLEERLVKGRPIQKLMNSSAEYGTPLFSEWTSLFRSGVDGAPKDDGVLCHVLAHLLTGPAWQKVESTHRRSEVLERLVGGKKHPLQKGAVVVETTPGKPTWSTAASLHTAVRTVSWNEDENRAVIRRLHEAFDRNSPGWRQTIREMFAKTKILPQCVETTREGVQVADNLLIDVPSVSPETAKQLLRLIPKMSTQWPPREVLRVLAASAIRLDDSLSTDKGSVPVHVFLDDMKALPMAQAVKRLLLRKEIKTNEGKTLKNNELMPTL